MNTPLLGLTVASSSTDIRHRDLVEGVRPGLFDSVPPFRTTGALTEAERASIRSLFRKGGDSQ